MDNSLDEFGAESAELDPGGEAHQENRSSQKLEATPERRENSEIMSSENLFGQRKIDRNHWGIGIAGGAPGINAMLEIDGQTGYTVIALANYDPPAARDMARIIRRYLKAVKNGDTL